MTFDPCKLPDQNQLHKPGDRVIRPIYRRGTLNDITSYRRGVVTRAYLTRPGVGTTPYYLYAILWDNTTTPEEGYFGSGLTPEPLPFPTLVQGAS